MQRTTILPIFFPYHGCQQRCSYCNQNITGGTSSDFDAPDIEQNLETYLRSLSPQKRGQKIEVALYGGSFIAPPAQEWVHILERLGSFVKRGRIDGIRISTRPDSITEEIGHILARHGVTTVELGVPSLDQQVLDLAGRGHTVEDVRTACSCLRHHSLNVGFQLMFGLPGDTRKTMAQTLALVCAWQPDFVRIHPAIVLKGTALARQYLSGEYMPLSLARAVVISSVWQAQFERANIAVIRTGLQATDTLAGPGAVLGGPFHPAFGELVRQYACRKELLLLLKNLPEALSEVSIEVPADRLSQYIGQHRQTIAWLRKKKPRLREIKIVAGDDVESQSIRFSQPRF